MDWEALACSFLTTNQARSLLSPFDCFFCALPSSPARPPSPPPAPLVALARRAVHHSFSQSLTVARLKPLLLTRSTFVATLFSPTPTGLNTPPNPIRLSTLRDALWSSAWSPSAASTVHTAYHTAHRPYASAHAYVLGVNLCLPSASPCFWTTQTRTTRSIPDRRKTPLDKDFPPLWLIWRQSQAIKDVPLSRQLAPLPSGAISL